MQLWLQTAAQPKQSKPEAKPPCRASTMHVYICGQFDGVLEGASQDAVYAAAAQDAVDAVMGGFNATIFCYGQVRRAGPHTRTHTDQGRCPAVRGCTLLHTLPLAALPGSVHTTASRRKAGHTAAQMAKHFRCVMFIRPSFTPCIPTCRPQTGAGKTFTMCGDARNYHHRGIIPRALQQIFREIHLRTDKMYRCDRGPRR